MKLPSISVWDTLYLYSVVAVTVLKLSTTTAFTIIIILMYQKNGGGGSCCSCCCCSCICITDIGLIYDIKAKNREQYMYTTK